MSLVLNERGSAACSTLAALASWQCSRSRHGARSGQARWCGGRRAHAVRSFFTLAPPGKQPSLLPEEPPQVVTDRHRQRGRAVDRDGRVSAYTWLLKHGDDTQLFTHLDGALLVDVWPDVAPHLTEKLRSQWGPLVLSAGEG